MKKGSSRIFPPSHISPTFSPPFPPSGTLEISSGLPHTRTDSGLYFQLGNPRYFS